MTWPYPTISPDIIHIGPLRVRWYGMMYVLGYIVAGRLCKIRMRQGTLPLTQEGLDSFLTALFIGMLLGARAMYVLVYDRSLLTGLDWLKVWNGGLSFHGAAAGMILACIWTARHYKVPIMTLTDTLALCATPGLAFGRIGNFINAELYGRASDVPWAMVFPTDPQQIPRHPSQLYECLGEGVILGTFLWWLEAKARREGWWRPGVGGTSFLIGYGIIRSLIELTRQPDAQLGFLAGGITMGQLLSSLMIIGGIAVASWVYRQPPQTPKPVAHAGAATA